MSDYILKDNEVKLFDGEVGLSRKGSGWHLVLTNESLIFTKKGMFKKNTSIEVIPLNTIKFHNGKPQIKQTLDTVNIQTTGQDLSIIFEGIIAAKKFVEKVVVELTGEVMTKRGFNKINKSLDMVNESFGVDTVGAVKNVFENGIVGTIIGGKKGKKGAVEDVIGSISNNSMEKQLDILKKLKELLDEGIITQEEFDAKKKEILNM